MASKSADVRPKITMTCVDCKERNYITRKNRPGKQQCEALTLSHIFLLHRQKFLNNFLRIIRAFGKHQWSQVAMPSSD